MLEPEHEEPPSYWGQDPGLDLLDFARWSAAARSHPRLLTTDELLAKLPELPPELKDGIHRLRASHQLQAQERYESVVERLIGELGSDLGPRLTYETVEDVAEVIWRDGVELYRAIAQAFISAGASNLPKLLEDVETLVIRNSSALMRHTTKGTWFQVGPEPRRAANSPKAGTRRRAESKNDSRPAISEEVSALCEIAGLPPDFAERLMQQNLSMGEARRQIVAERANREGPEIHSTITLPDPCQTESGWWGLRLETALAEAIEPVRRELTKAALRSAAAEFATAQRNPDPQFEGAVGEHNGDSETYRLTVEPEIVASRDAIRELPQVRKPSKKERSEHRKVVMVGLEAPRVYNRAFPELKSKSGKAREIYKDWLKGSYEDGHEVDLKLTAAAEHVRAEESCS